MKYIEQLKNALKYDIKLRNLYNELFIKETSELMSKISNVNEISCFFTTILAICALAICNIKFNLFPQGFLGLSLFILSIFSTIVITAYPICSFFSFNKKNDLKFFKYVPFLSSYRKKHLFYKKTILGFSEEHLEFIKELKNIVQFFPEKEKQVILSYDIEQLILEKNIEKISEYLYYFLSNYISVSDNLQQQIKEQLFIEFQNHDKTDTNVYEKEINSIKNIKKAL